MTTPPQPNWPFPPASGPKPWTPAQKAADDALDLMDELSRPEYAGPLGGIRMTEPADVSWRFSRIDGDLSIRGRGKNYSSVVYFERCSRVDQYGNTHRGGVWWGDEDRKDQRGVEWTRRFNDLVTDDYGQLVSSDTGVAP